MTNTFLDETLNSDNIIFYIKDIIAYENSNYYYILNKKSYTEKNICDHLHEEKLFYKNIYNDLILYYKPLLKKYPFLQNNYNNLENFISIRL